jgi:hypothetical protein
MTAKDKDLAIFELRLLNIRKDSMNIEIYNVVKD